ncbi:MAG TPA: hypothetical protein ENI81_11080, partial [Phycisphaerales bacterium]|nr:hypothetical protein [Phycisphaerales bacterium]
MSGNIRVLCVVVSAVFLLSLPDVGTSAIPAEETAALRAAIEDLTGTFGRQYPQGRDYLSKLDDVERRGDQDQFETLRREALVANLLVSGNPILFVMRAQYKKDHHNTATMFKTGEINTKSFSGGGALKTIDFGRGGKVETLIETSEGLIRDPEVHFDGGRIVFAMRKNIDDDYHIYEINADATGLKQLTSAPGVADFDPLYLPDDSIVFSSTREPKY